MTPGRSRRATSGPFIRKTWGRSSSTRPTSRARSRGPGPRPPRGTRGGPAARSCSRRGRAGGGGGAAAVASAAFWAWSRARAGGAAVGRLVVPGDACAHAFLPGYVCARTSLCVRGRDALQISALIIDWPYRCPQKAAQLGQQATLRRELPRDRGHGQSHWPLTRVSGQPGTSRSSLTRDSASSACPRTNGTELGRVLLRGWQVGRRTGNASGARRRRWDATSLQTMAEPRTTANCPEEAQPGASGGAQCGRPRGPASWLRGGGRLWRQSAGFLRNNR